MGPYRLVTPRLKKQIERLCAFTCDSGLCVAPQDANRFRFPFCAAFLRPTDKLQTPDQTLISSGEHLPICQIEACSSEGRGSSRRLLYDDIREVSLSQEVFEDLFKRGKIGSRSLTYDELATLYDRFDVSTSRERLLIHAQDFDPLRPAASV